MKWNTMSVSAACLVIGLGAYMIGKRSNGNPELSENDSLLSATEPQIPHRFSSSGSNSRNQQDSSRPGRESASTSFERKLMKMEEILRDPNVLERGRAMLDWVDSLSPDEFEAAVTGFRGLKNISYDRMNNEFAMLLTAWAEFDPLAAIDYTSKHRMSRSPTTGDSRSIVLDAWVNRNPEEAIAWAKANPEGKGENTDMGNIISALARTDIDRATELLEEMPQDGWRVRALYAVAPSVLKQGSEAAKKWASEIKDERLREEAIARISVTMAVKDPASAATWLLSNLSPGNDPSVNTVFNSWAKLDPTAAMTSFEGLPKGNARSYALGGIVAAEISRDPVAAAQLMSHYQDDLTDQTVTEFVWRASGQAPELAVNQISLIKDESARNLVYPRALGFWLLRDKEAAQMWIDGANLPPDVIDSAAKYSRIRNQ